MLSLHTLLVLTVSTGGVLAALFWAAKLIDDNLDKAGKYYNTAVAVLVLIYVATLIAILLITSFWVSYIFSFIF